MKRGFQVRPRRTKMQSRIILVAFLLIGVLGCGSQTTDPRTKPMTPPATSFPRVHLNRAQPKLPTIKIWLGARVLTAEIARTPVQMATGMMHRTEMGENEAMLFVYNAPQQAAFYMKNTLLPLSCAYIDPEGVIREIHDLQPKNEQSVAASTDQIQFVLETPQGWFAKNQVAVGTIVVTEQGTLQETFFPTDAPP